MQISQCLQMLSEATVKAILSEQNQRLQQLGQQELLDRLTDGAFLASVWERLTEPEKSVIRLFLREARQGFLSKKQWDKLAQREHLHLSHGLTHLRRLGLIYTVRKLWSEVGYILPAELRERFAQLFHSEAMPAKKASVHLGNQTLPYYIPSGRGIHLDVFALLLFIRDHQVPITQKRTIHRRFLQKVTASLSLTKEHVSEFCHSLGLSDEKPEASVVLDVALRLGLVRAEEKQLRLVQPEVDHWLGLSAQDRWEQLFRLVSAHYLPHECWYEAILYEMKRHRGEEWEEVGALVKRLDSLGYHVPQTAVQEITSRWLHLLLGFGWIQLGMGEAEQLYWRWNPIIHGMEADGWYVEPTGDVLIPPLVPLKRIWEISRLGDLAFEGELIRCGLAAEKVKELVGCGNTEEQLIQLLQKSCVHPLPEAVVNLIHLWAKATRQIRFERIVRVKTAQPTFLQELRQIEAFAPFLQEIISETDFLIEARQENALYEHLRQYGFEPRIEHAESDTDKLSVEAGQAGEGAGLFAIDRPWEGYQVENVFPERYESMPEMSRLPKMWTQHYQAYHPQTMRDLFKRALELQIEVRIEHAAGGEWQGIPSSVEAQMGYWYITLESDRKKQRCKLDDIRRVRILLPDYL